MGRPAGFGVLKGQRRHHTRGYRRPSGGSALSEEQLQLESVPLSETERTIGAVGIVMPQSVNVAGIEPTTAMTPSTSFAWSGNSTDFVTPWMVRSPSAVTVTVSPVAAVVPRSIGWVPG